MIDDGLNGHMPGPVAGIDIGGTKIATLIVDADGAVLGRATHASSVGDQDGAVASIAACLDEALAKAGLQRDDLRAVGVGVPGRVDPVRGRVTLAVNLGWTDFALRDALAVELGTPVFIENDVRAAAIGLYQRHVVEGQDLAYLAVGTGIAAGVVLDGKLHRGARGLGPVLFGLCVPIRYRRGFVTLLSRESASNVGPRAAYLAQRSGRRSRVSRSASARAESSTDRIACSVAATSPDSSRYTA